MTSNFTSNSAAICVKQLDPEWNDIWIRKKFAEFGTIVNLDVPIHRNGNRKGIAFIQYSTAEEARAAITNLNNKKLENRTIGVEFLFSSTATQKKYSDDEDDIKEEEDSHEKPAYIKYPRRDIGKGASSIPRPTTPPTPPPSPPPAPPPIELLVEEAAPPKPPTVSANPVTSHTSSYQHSTREYDRDEKRYKDDRSDKRYRDDDRWKPTRDQNRDRDERRDREKDKDRHRERDDRDERRDRDRNRDRESSHEKKKKERNEKEERKSSRDKDRERDRRHERDREKERSRSPSRYVRSDRHHRH